MIKKKKDQEVYSASEGKYSKVSVEPESLGRKLLENKHLAKDLPEDFKAWEKILEEKTKFVG